jgi:hypothetical protein
VERRTVADFQIADVLSVRVLGQLERGPDDRLPPLEDAEREIEGFQVFGKAHAGGQAREEAIERGGVANGKTKPLFPTQLQERLGTKGTVQMDVEVGLG